MYDRKMYVNKIMLYTDMPFIKIITGIQRCGKTTILEIIQEKLHTIHHIPTEQMIHFHFDKMQYNGISAASLENEIIKQLRKNERTYLFLDEVNALDGWEHVVSAIQSEFNVDIYISSSSAQFSSSQLDEALAGRYIIFQVFPLSFKEYLESTDKIDLDEVAINKVFLDYIHYGGLPMSNRNNMSEDEIYSRVDDVASAIIYTQVLQHNKIRRPEHLDQVLHFIYEYIGQTYSAKAIVDALVANHQKADNETVSSYLEKLESAYLIQRCSRYDLKQRSLLKTQQKFYLTELSMRHAQLGFIEKDFDAYVENIVYLELCRRGYKVYVGKLGKFEINFIAQKADDTLYIQLLKRGSTKEEIAQQYEHLLSIRDNYPKYMLETDTSSQDNYHGIKTMQVIDFLLMKQ